MIRWKMPTGGRGTTIDPRNRIVSGIATEE